MNVLHGGPCAGGQSFHHRMIAPPRSHGGVSDQLDHDLFTKFPLFCLLWFGLSTLGNDRTSFFSYYSRFSLLRPKEVFFPALHHWEQAPLTYSNVFSAH